MPSQGTMIIVNPMAGSGMTRWKWPLINARLKHIGLSFDYRLTEYTGHAIELARAAADDGYECVVAVGGDGTVHEVVNGILNSSASGNTALGIIMSLLESI